MPPIPTTAELRARGLAAGLVAVGVTAAVPFERTRRDLESRRAAGYAADMQFTYRNPSRSADPSRALPDARSLVVGASRYPAATPARPAGGPMGRVARYAGEDRYAVLRRGLTAVAEVLDDAGWRTRVLADDNALVDREAARRAGIGHYGKSSNLLVAGVGSWVVLGSVLTDAPLDATPAVVGGEAASEEADETCGSCTRCLEGCPTAAIVAPGVVDARRCLAWLLQQPGSFPLPFRRALGDRVYGCDDCQEVCPPNRSAGDGGVAVGHWVDLVELLDLDDDALMARVGRWYVPGRDPSVVRRNLLVALGNSGAGGPGVERVLRRSLGHEDPMVREHAEWAAAELAGGAA